MSEARAISPSDVGSGTVLNAISLNPTRSPPRPPGAP